MLLRVEQLQKSFSGLHAVDDVSFEIGASGITALIGPNGAGKSTLLNLISGLIVPSSGRIFFKGENITRLSPTQRTRKGIGKSFQVVSLFPELTVAEHILIAITKNYIKPRYSKQDIEKLNRILANLAMVDKSNRIVGTLPHSEQRVLDVGLLVALDCELLLLDEPFAGLAANQICDLEQMILELAKQKSIFIVEHRMNVLMGLTSRLIVMARGRIVADGTPDELRHDKRIQECYFGGGLDVETP